MDPEVNRPPSEDNRDNNPNEANETEQAMDQQDSDSDHDGKFANRCRSVPEIIDYWNHQLTNVSYLLVSRTYLQTNNNFFSILICYNNYIHTKINNIIQGCKWLP